jgi:hypothetical protein
LVVLHGFWAFCEKISPPSVGRCSCRDSSSDMARIVTVVLCPRSSPGEEDRPNYLWQIAPYPSYLNVWSISSRLSLCVDSPPSSFCWVFLGFTKGRSGVFLWGLSPPVSSKGLATGGLEAVQVKSRKGKVQFYECSYSSSFFEVITNYELRAESSPRIKLFLVEWVNYTGLFVLGGLGRSRAVT